MIGFTRPLGATPFIPERDADVLERLPTTLGGDAGELRGLRTQLARAPTDVAQAVAVAGRYIELGQSQTDARYYGYAQAALAPWWGLPDPPPEVLLLRAAIRRADMSSTGPCRTCPDCWRRIRAIPLGSCRPSFSSCAATTGVPRQACEALAQLRRAFSSPSAAWEGLASLSGQAEGGLADCSSSQRGIHMGLRRPSRCAWRRCSERPRNGWAIGSAPEVRFPEAQRLGPHDAYLLGTYADFLLNQGRAGEVVALLRDETRVDGLLLRLTLAEHEIGAPGEDAHIEELRARFAAKSAARR